jgi:hypothetical protein
MILEHYNTLITVNTQFDGAEGHKQILSSLLHEVAVVLHPVTHNGEIRAETKLRGLSQRANYTIRAATAS